MKDTIQDPRRVWKTYSGKVATPTIIFATITISAYIFVIYQGMVGSWSLGVCCLLNTILTYLLFTVLHEAVHGNISGII